MWSTGCLDKTKGEKSMNILGISGLYHDSAAALCCDGEIVAAVQEERFTRKKADAAFPENAIQYCLSRLSGDDIIDAVVYYDNPMLTLDRWLHNCIQVSPDNSKIIRKSFYEIFGNRLWVHEKIKNIMMEREGGAKASAIRY